ncbi:MAG: pimeloyl-ACP methyl ester carboxylesterase [Candidatus Poriferisodalaceae bacterium]|jgi:pimeloyl-ACP methyl ester carboxylesterase
MHVTQHTVLGHPTRVQVGGDGPALVFLHGQALTWEWTTIHDELATQFTVYAPIHPGFGGEDIPKWLDDVHDMTFHNAALINELGLDQPLVAGVSLGGWLALDLAVHRPDLVGAVLAVGALGLRPQSPMPDLFIKHAPEALGYLANTFDTAPYDALTGDVDAATDLWVEQATQARLMWERPYDPRLARRLELVACPSTVLWGGGDRLLPPEHGRRLAELMGADFDVAPESGHMVTADAPGAVVAAASRLHQRRKDIS